jgi:hypothetical protein
MAILFDTILSKGIREGNIPARTQEARDWYRNTAQQQGKINETSLLKGSDATRFTSSPRIGQMYMFTYNPKHKDTLPYWDRFPLVFPFRKVPGGFLGMNMHYLPLPYRAKLMDGLYSITNNTLYNDTTKLKLNYDLLNGAAQFKYFKPTVKHYLSDHLTSKFLYIFPAEWDVALFLPLSRFQKAANQKVWADSVKIIRGR